MINVRAPSRSAIVLTLALVALSFVAATAVAEYNDLRIQEASRRMIATSTGKEHLDLTRSELHKLELGLGGHGVETTVMGPGEASQLLERVIEQWQAYRDLPAFSDEQAVQPAIDRRLEALRGSIVVMDRVANAGGDVGALRKHIVFDIDETEQDLVTLFAIHRREMVNVGAQVNLYGHRSITWAIVLDSLSVLLTAVAGALLLSVTSRYEKLLSGRAEELDQFAGRVAHDILSPLSAVGMSIDLAERHAPIEGGTRRALARGRRNVDRAQVLVEDLLQFARAGARPDPDARANVRSAVEGAIEEVRSSANAAGVTLLMGSLPSSEVSCSPGSLNSVLSNLLNNAIKHMGPSATRRVVLSAIEEERFVHFEVDDTGPGLPADLGERVFEPYVRGSNADVPGLGLGLATVKRIAESYGGKVGAESIPGEGSKFWFVLPKAQPLQEGHTHPTEQAPT
jgi:signal transduction histidine kinase